MANQQFPTNASVQYDGASPLISQASQIARGFHKDAVVVANTPVHQSMPQYPANVGCQSSIGIRPLGNYSPYFPSTDVPSFTRQSTFSPPQNAVTQIAKTNLIQEHVNRDTTSQEVNASESVAGIMQGLTGLTLDPSKRELVQPQESTSLAAALSAIDSDSACVMSSGSFPQATAPDCAEDRSGSAGDSGYASGASGSGAGALAAVMPDAKIEPRIVLTMQKLDVIYMKRNVTRSAVAEGAASIDLFYGVDDDSDTQLHICLYDYKQYFSEAWNLVAGSRPEWLSLKNKRGFTPLMCAVMYCADVDMVRALSILSVSLPLSDLRGYTALHYAAILGRLELVDAMLLEPTQHEYLLVREFHRDHFPEPHPELSYQELLARHRAAVAILLASRNVAGETPLFCAVKSSNFEVTACLLAMRADPRIAELSEGKTTLHQAVQLLQTKIVHALLSYPSPQMVEELVNLKTRAGATPLRTARRMICSDPLQKAELAEIIARLVGAGGRDSLESSDESDSEQDEAMRSNSSSPVSDVEGEERAESQHAN